MSRLAALVCTSLTTLALCAPAAHAARLRFAHRNADGGVTRGFNASNSKGSVQSQGSATRDAQGNLSQSRSTTATSASTGDTLKSSTSYSKDTGLTHSVSCFDAGGNAIACPKK